MRHVDPKVEEAIETLNMKDGPSRRKLLTGTGLVSATAAASALLAACSSSSSSGATATQRGRELPEDPGLAVLVRQPRLPQPVLRADPVRLPGRRRTARPAHAELGRVGVDLERPGDGDLPEHRHRGEGRRDRDHGHQLHRVHHPGGQRHERGHPVITYNADGLYKPGGVPDIGTNRLCYVGQALFISGEQMGNRITSLIPGGGDIVIFIATPGTGNIQPRYDGAASVLKAPSYTVHEIATGAATSAELPAEKAFLAGAQGQGQGRVRGGRGLHRATSAQALAANRPDGPPERRVRPDPADAARRSRQAPSTSPSTRTPYLQGFLPMLYLYLYNLSGGLVYPPNTDTGLTFVTKDNVGPYLSTTSRFEGSTAAAEVHPAAVRADQEPDRHHQHLTRAPGGRPPAPEMAPAGDPGLGQACRRRILVLSRRRPGCRRACPA